MDELDEKMLYGYWNNYTGTQSFKEDRSMLDIEELCDSVENKESNVEDVLDELKEEIMQPENNNYNQNNNTNESKLLSYAAIALSSVSLALGFLTFKGTQNVGISLSSMKKDLQKGDTSSNNKEDLAKINTTILELTTQIKAMSNNSNLDKDSKELLSKLTTAVNSLKDEQVSMKTGLDKVNRLINEDLKQVAQPSVTNKVQEEKQIEDIKVPVVEDVPDTTKKENIVKEAVVPTKEESKVSQTDKLLEEQIEDLKKKINDLQPEKIVTENK